uniref:transcription factor Gibbin-like n=1 Tax=Doryrhamphus excisus TaxID=161450 RepID=UPI0025AEA841|nr:transcription factor Gibbin-like [Doryrhamphus excisus]XP_057903601.1 transcription factor Gibbin-like [Doryrhamphus excisus]XP_057903602.1 transcription factor Gibbin-like [Doryrhamphus excisus]
MQTRVDAQTLPRTALDSCGPARSGSAGAQPLSLALGNHPASTDQVAVRTLAAEMDIPSNICPVPASLNQNTGATPLLVEAERKYALRSSGRSRFPCHVRKSSRLRRTLEDGERRADKERVDEEDVKASEEKIWRVKEEKGEAVMPKQEQPSVEAPPPAAVCPPDVPLALTVPKVVPKAAPKPAPRLGHRPGPKSRSRPGPKSVQKPGPKSVMRRRLAAAQQAVAHCGAAHLPSAIVAASPPPHVKKEPVAVQILSPSGRRCGRFVGVRRIVVKVARIPVSLGRRQKSYKISNVETVTGTEKSNDGNVDGSDVAKEPTALLRMKNNGKSVMVMFPPGELPVILKRRRGRPPKQAMPVAAGEPPSACGNGDQIKKPRRKRRTKLPCPYPSYVNDTNDVKTEYGDVLSKLAFLNRQPPTTGRCSPPRCWTPSEPESFHTPLENPGLSTLLHRLTGFRRPRGGRGGTGRGGGAAGGAGGSEHNKSTFSDFFESIGKKRKLSPLSEHGLPRKRGKGVGGVGRGGGVVGTEPAGEKTIRKRRVRKNGTFKGEGDGMGQDWPNGSGGWGDKALRGYQLCGATRGGFSSCEVGRRGGYGRSGGGRGVGPPGEDSQGLFAGYFRSLLDSDDSSELLDISQSNARKAASAPGYEPSSPAPGQRWSPAIPKWGANGTSSAADGSVQTHSSSYGYGGQTQTSPTPSTYHKSTPPSLSHSPSSPHPANYGHYSPAYASSSCVGPQRSSDCSFSYSKTVAQDRGQMGYSGYQAATRKAYGGSATAGPASPGAGFMSVAKGSPFGSSSSPECYKQYNCNQWTYRQGCSGWSADNFGPHAYSEYGCNESKDILDISNYTPQKAKRPPFPESLSESSSDSSHPGSAAAGSGPPSSMGGVFKQMETMSGDGGPSSLSSLEKLMIDWHESASGPSYSWSQNVLFQGGGTSKPGRGRRKRTEQSDKEGGSVLHSDSPSSPSPTPTPGPKRGGAGGRGRGSRGARGGLSGCQRERLSGSKGRGKSATAGAAPGLEGSGLFQEGLDYYSGDSSSLSPLATPNPAPPSSYLQDPCEYPSPYSAHPSTPSSEERYPALYPGESSSSLSPSVSSPPYPPKAQSYHLVPSRTFSPSCSPLPRVTPHCSSASPSHRPPPKEAQFSQYDSPSYCGSPYWYGQTSHSSSPSPSTSTHPHTSPHANTHGNLLASPNAHVNPSPHDPQHHNAHVSLSSHAKSYPANPAHANNQPHHAHAAHSLYDDCSTAAVHKQELTMHAIATGSRQGLLTPPPLYTKATLDPLPPHEQPGGYALSQLSCQGMGHRYPSQVSQGAGGVLCQLLDPAHDDSFSVTSL